MKTVKEVRTFVKNKELIDERRRQIFQGAAELFLKSHRLRFGFLLTKYVCINQEVQKVVVVTTRTGVHGYFGAIDKTTNKDYTQVPNMLNDLK